MLRNYITSTVAVLKNDRVELADVSLRLDGSGMLAIDAASNEIEGHQALWCARSQFMSDTLLWVP